MFVFGITGPSGSGKGVLCSYLTKAGIRVIDCDRIYHDIILPPSRCLDELKNTGLFPEDVFGPDGSLNRPKMASLVFQPENKSLLHTLNEITHRYVMEEVNRILGESRQKNQSAAVDAPLLFEADVPKKCSLDFTIAVLSRKDLRVNRIMERDGLLEEEALQRIESQPSDAFYKERATYILENNGPVEDFLKEASELMKKWRIE